MNNFITLQEATELTARFRDNREKMLMPTFKDALSFSITFEAQAIRALIDQTDCVSFRMYNGMNEDLTVCAVFVGVNEQGEDILNGENSIILDKGIKCPPDCPVSML